jgi:prefoldin subunit 5
MTPPMPSADKLEQRLNELRRENEAGEAQLRALTQRTEELQRTLMRIRGAIQVLEELLEEARRG